MEKIGLIAGNGQFPIIFTKSLVSKHFDVYVAAYVEEANSKLAEIATGFKWVHPGQVNTLIKFFKKNSITTVTMLGSIKKRKLFKNIKPDIKAISIMARIKSTHDDTIMRAFAKSLKKSGIDIESSTKFLPELIATQGIWTKKKPSHFENKDINLGIPIAKEIGRLDIGQSIIIGQGSVLAVEAIDGTDATIRRGGKLSNKKAVLIKVCKPNQDLRFDIPAIGVKTIETMHENNIGTLVIEAGTTVVFDKEEMIQKANNYNIAIVSL